MLLLQCDLAHHYTAHHCKTLHTIANCTLFACYYTSLHNTAIIADFCDAISHTMIATTCTSQCVTFIVLLWSLLGFFVVTFSFVVRENAGGQHHKTNARTTMPRTADSAPIVHHSHCRTPCVEGQRWQHCASGVHRFASLAFATRQIQQDTAPRA